MKILKCGIKPLSRFLSILIILVLFMNFAHLTLLAASDDVVHTKAGMKVRIRKKDYHHKVNTHSIKGTMELPFVKKGYVHPVKVHKKGKDGVVSVFTTKPFTCNYGGMKIKVNSALHDKKTDSFRGHGEIKSPVISDGKINAGKITFNHKGISSVDKVSSDWSYRVKGLLFTPEKVWWQNQGLMMKGILSLGNSHPQVTLFTTGNLVRVEKLHNPFRCLVDNRPVTVNVLRIKNGKLFASGEAHTFDGKVIRFIDGPVDKKGNLTIKLPKPRKPKSYADFEKRIIAEDNKLRKRNPKKNDKHAGTILLASLLTEPFFIVPDVGYNSTLIYKRAASILTAQESWNSSSLPGRNLIKVAKTNMVLKITSALRQDDRIVSGYVSIPDPVSRVNTFNFEAGEEGADLSDAKIYWDKEKFTIPLTGNEITLKNPGKLVFDDEGENGQFMAYTKGIIDIQELSLPSFMVLADNQRVDYRVQIAKASSVFKAIKGYCPFTVELPDVHFDVIQGRNYIGAILNAETGAVETKPDLRPASDMLSGKPMSAKGTARAGIANVAWLNVPSVVGPTVIVKVFTNGYVHVYFNGGTALEVPIIPEVVVAEEFIFEFTRDPDLFTDVVMGATLSPEKPELKKLGIKIVGKQSFDLVGMYTQVGQQDDLYVFYEKVSEVNMGYNSYHKQFTAVGDVDIKGLPFCDDAGFMMKFDGSSPVIKGGAQAKLKFTKWIKKIVSVTKHIPLVGWVTKHVVKWVKKIIEKVCAITWWVNKSGSVGFKLGSLDFKVDQKHFVGTYNGPVTIDGITYYGNMVIDTKTGNASIIGTSHNLTGSAGGSSVSGTLTLDTKEDELGIEDGELTSKFDLTLDINTPFGSKTVPFKDLESKFVNDPDTGYWEANAVNIEVSFTYVDNDGNVQTFDQECPLRMTLEHNMLRVYLDLPGNLGGTFEQLFSLKD